MMSFRRSVSRRIKLAYIAVVAGTAGLAAGGLIAPTPALAWWRGGVWVAPGYPYARPYYAPRPYYYAPPPIVVAPPPVYYAPPPVVYAPPPPPPVYYRPPGAGYPVPARNCYAPALTCPMEVARSPGTACYCSGAGGVRVWGTAH
ncbi:MAG: hypothetical protein HIU92_06685 [Proteobacteria bacterium]|nr:hypothetical protein [Pseudomonadota bacterium]